MDINSHSVNAHFADLERQVKPQLAEFRKERRTHVPLLSVISILGAVLVAGTVFPLV